MNADKHFDEIEKLLEWGYQANPGKEIYVEIPGHAWEECVQSLGKGAVGMLNFHRKNFRFRGEAIVRGAKWLVHVVEGK